MDNLKLVRKAAGFTRTRLARESGVSRWRLALAEVEGEKLNEAEVAALRRVLKPLLLELARDVMEFQASGS